MDKFFSFLGKLFLFAGIAGILIGGGYYLGTKLAKPSEKTQSIALTAVPSASMTTSPVPTTTPSSQKTNTGHFAVTAGGIKPFSAYMLSGVTGWTPTKTHTSALDKTILSQGLYSVTILQGAFGGGGCTFPGDKPAEMSVQLTTSTMIPLLSGNPLRRGQAPTDSPNSLSFTVCQKAADGSYGTFTDFGAINYTTPLNPTSEMLAEMDAMVGSLQKQ